MSSSACHGSHQRKTPVLQLSAKTGQGEKGHSPARCTTSTSARTLPLHSDPGLAKTTAHRALCSSPGKHPPLPTSEFPSHLPEKHEEVLLPTEHDSKAQIHNKRRPRVKAGLYFYASVAPENIPPPAFQITTDEPVTKMQNWFRKYLIISL